MFIDTFRTTGHTSTTVAYHDDTYYVATKGSTLRTMGVPANLVSASEWVGLIVKSPVLGATTIAAAYQNTDVPLYRGDTRKAVYAQLATAYDAACEAQRAAWAASQPEHTPRAATRIRNFTEKLTEAVTAMDWADGEISVERGATPHSADRVWLRAPGTYAEVLVDPKRPLNANDVREQIVRKVYYARKDHRCTEAARAEATAYYARLTGEAEPTPFDAHAAYMERMRPDVDYMEDPVGAVYTDTTALPAPPAAPEGLDTEPTPFTGEPEVSVTPIEWDALYAAYESTPNVVALDTAVVTEPSVTEAAPAATEADQHAVLRREAAYLLNLCGDTEAADKVQGYKTLRRLRRIIAGCKEQLGL